MPPQIRSCAISALSPELIDELNRRMAAGEAPRSLALWLNAFPEVQQRIPGSEGRSVTEATLEEWRATGYIEWTTSVGIHSQTAHFTQSVQALAQTGLTSELLLFHVTAMYAVILPHWDGSAEGPFADRLRAIGTVSKDICNLRKSEHTGQRLALEQEKFEYSKSQARAESAPQSSPAAANQPARAASPAVQPASATAAPIPKSAAAPAPHPIAPARPTKPHSFHAPVTGTPSAIR